MNEEEANALDASQQRHNTSVKRRIEKKKRIDEAAEGKKEPNTSHCFKLNKILRYGLLLFELFGSFSVCAVRRHKNTSTRVFSV